MKKGQWARRLKVPGGTDHSTDRSSGGGAARARRAQSQRRRRSFGGRLLGRLGEFGRTGPERPQLAAGIVK